MFVESVQGGFPIDTLTVAQALAAVALDKKALNPVLLEVGSLASYADYLLIVTATSSPHVSALADACRNKAKELGVQQLSSEGLSSGKWVLMDFGDVVLHIFQPNERIYYDLETLWPEAPRIEIPGADEATVDSNALFAS